jgi:DNA polymerase-3 subunit alpha
MDFIQTWILANSLNVEWLNERSFVLDGKKYLCVLAKDGKLFNESFEIILDQNDVYAMHAMEHQFFCFAFGGKVYYSPSDNTKCKLLFLKHIGVAKDLSGFPYLGIHGGYELCAGSRVYEDWCAKAKFFGINALGISERHTLAGALKFQESCAKAKIKSIIGETITVKGKEEYKVKLYVANEVGWRNLLRIHKILNVDNNSINVDESVLSKYSKGIYCVFQSDTFLTQDIELEALFWKFEDIYFQLDPAQFKAVARDTHVLQCLKNYFNYRKQFKLALICDSYYLDKEDFKVKEILKFIGGGAFDYQSQDQYFKSLEDICLQLSDMFTSKGDDFAADILQQALAGLDEIVSGCDFKIRQGEIHLPKYELSEVEAGIFQDNNELFWHLINKGLDEKVSAKGKNYDAYVERVAIEADVIIRGGFIDYFLILRDIINWCENNDILVGTGRGSVGGSVIAYLLNVTKVDAIEYGLLFERFLNESRIGKGLPDIDTDFESGRRDDVKRYIEHRYGKDNVCSIGTYNTLQLKAAFNDILRYHGEQPQNIRFNSAMISESNDDLETLFYDAANNFKLKEFINYHINAINDLHLVLGQAKSSSIHAAGIVITPLFYKGEPMQIYDWFPCKLSDGILISEWEGPSAG